MKMKIIISFFLVGLLSITLISFKDNRRCNINGIWIPEKINWKDGSFYTIYAYNDTNFIIVASSQSKNKNGTINFMSEEGFVVNYGHIGKCVDDCKLSIVYRTLHRSVALTNKKLPSDILKSTFILNKKTKSKPELLFDNERYLRTNLYTTTSVEKIKSIASKLVPMLLKENNLSE